MDDYARSFVHDFQPGGIHFGRGRVADLGTTLASHDCERALVVTGTNVGANDAVMDPIREGLGERLAGVFAETTPAKSLATAFEGIERMAEMDVDALVGVGGGSSLDTATVMSALARADRTLADVRQEVAERGGISTPTDPSAYTPLFPVPTTLAGADLSTGGGINVTLESGDVVGSGVRDEHLMPEALCYDPDLFETTPTGALTGSAMNGFDKGVEAVYSRNAEPMTDATATRGLEFLRTALPAVRETTDPTVMERVVLGSILVQYGVSAPGAHKLSLIHAFGHGLRDVGGVQQGLAHAVMAPHALSFLFDRVDARRDLLADAFGVDADDAMASAAGVVEAVTAVRDGLGLPDRLRDLDGVARERLGEIAEITHADGFMSNGPPDFDPSVEDLRGVLREAW